MSVELPEIEGFSPDQVLTLANCRSLEQYRSMIDDYRSGRCPFCDPLDLTKNIVLYQVDGWRMWRSPFSYAHCRHFVMAPIRHVGCEDEISVEDFTAMGKMFLFARQELGVMGGGVVMRFGGPKLSACSVLHLHTNILVPDLTGPVEATLSKHPDRQRQNIARLRVFEFLRQGCSVDALSAEERALVEGRI
jgi:hypothetical protein